MSKFFFVDIGRRRYSRDKEPDKCPICHYSIQADEIHWTLISIDGKPNSQNGLEIVYKCPRPECRHLFIARYLRSDIENSTNESIVAINSGIREFAYQESVPSTPQKPLIPTEITAISPLFSEIYNQAITAENFDLDQIAGGGYRKALEFLIKDYCISVNNDAESEIKSSYLGTCINKYVDNPQVKLCAERAAWLGNDEVHYVRRWTEKDISNLKELIILTMNWIHSCILTRKYVSEMPKEGK
jgi:hypothetical protein